MKRKASIFQRIKRKKDREGLTLIDMSLAIGVAAVMMLSTITFVADAQALRTEADRVAVAVALAQIQLSQLLSNPELTRMKRNGKFDRNHGIYAGYAWEVEVREEKLDLAKVAESGKLDSVPIDDQLPPSTQNQIDREKAGQGASTQTGGVVDIVRIIVRINYPRGGAPDGLYRVETIRGQRKQSQ